ncbi:ABC transporter substrate-binding protein [uncultured Enorma sp.]|uniref:ABC transporter substrate-binding protein n=1 Tax=uncultured Enorma sp. TaxID=1714346 RepID=UPI002623A6D1|nr:ABC transporter substrate-binding protein [uncultured Enorma sp.]
MSTPQVSRRQFLGGSAALLAMMGVGGLAGCSGGNGGSGSGAATGGIELTDTFTMISVAGNDSFDPIVGTGADKVTMHSLYDNLFMFDGEGNVEPMLVDTYEQEGNVVTATLREANFSDGNPVTADDVVYSWDMLRADPSQGPYMSNYITDVEKVDDKTVKITVVRDDTSWLNILAETIYIIPNGSYDPEANDYASTPMIGSGAYVFESVDEARTVTLKANEDYWGGAPTFKTVVVQAPVDSSTSLVALQNGEVNCVSMMAQTAVETAREDANLNVVEFEAWGQQMLGVLVGDQAFRSAIFHAINTQNIVDVVTGGAATPATQFFAKKLLGEDYDGVVTFEAYDLDLAKEELAKSETDLSQTFVITASDEAGAQCAQCIQQDLSAIGINVEVESVDTNTWSSKLMDQTLQMFINALGTDMLAVDSFIQLLFGDTSVYYYPISDEMKAKVAEMNAIPSVVERHDLVVELLNDMQVECPIVPLYDTVNYDVYTAGIEGYLPSSAGTYVYYLGKLTK